MANGSVDVLLRGIRGLGEGAESLGGGLARGRERRGREREAEQKREAERIRQERLGEVTADIETAQEELELLGPLATQEDFARLTADAAVGSAEVGDPSLLRTLDPFQQAILSHQKAERARIAAGETAAQKAAREAKTAKKTRFDQINKLKRRIDPVSKNTRQARQSFSTIQKAFAKGTPAGDVAGITAFAKSIDQGARVTDQDFKNAEKAKKTFEKLEAGTFPGQTGPVTIPTFFKSIITRLDPDKGTKLTDEQRGEFVDAAGAGLESALEEQVRAEEETFSFGQQFGIEAGEIVKRPASEDLREIREAAKTKAGQRRVKGLKPISRLQFNTEIMTPDNVAKFEAAKAQFAQINGREMTPEEIDDKIDEILEKKGLFIQE